MMDGPATEVSRGSMQLSELSFFEHEMFLFSADLSYERIKLGHLQTPIHAWNLPNAYVDDDESVSIFMGFQQVIPYSQTACGLGEI